MGADGQTSFNHGSSAAVGTAIEIHRMGGNVQIAGVSDRRQINIHNGFCRNLLVNAVKQRLQILHGIQGVILRRKSLVDKGQYLIGVLQPNGIAVFHCQRPHKFIRSACSGKKHLCTQKGRGERLVMARLCNVQSLVFVWECLQSAALHLGKKRFRVCQRSILENAKQGRQTGGFVHGKGKGPLFLRLLVSNGV